MHEATEFFVAVRLQELHREAKRNQFAAADRPSRFRKLVESVIETLRPSSAPATPALTAYPYAR